MKVSDLKHILIENVQLYVRRVLDGESCYCYYNKDCPITELPEELLDLEIMFLFPAGSSRSEIRVVDDGKPYDFFDYLYAGIEELPFSEEVTE